MSVSNLFNETSSCECEHQKTKASKVLNKAPRFFMCAMLLFFFSRSIYHFQFNLILMIWLIQNLIEILKALGKLRTNNKNSCDRTLFSETKQWKSLSLAGSRRLICQWFVVFKCLKQLKLRNLKGHRRFSKENYYKMAFSDEGLHYFTTFSLILKIF